MPTSLSKPLIELASGAFFDPAGCGIKGISVEDIAAGLAGICRYGGQSPQHYSVAEHAFLMSTVVPQSYALEALHHDDSEALGLGDIHGPIKQLMPGVKVLERKLNRRIARAFNLAPDFADLPIIKTYDAHMLKTEARAMMRSGGKGKGWHYPPRTRYLPIVFHYWNRDDAAENFLLRHEELVWLRRTRKS